MITLGSADPDSPEALVLLAELGAALSAITGDSGAASFDPQDVRGPAATRASISWRRWNGMP